MRNSKRLHLAPYKRSVLSRSSTPVDSIRSGPHPGSARLWEEWRDDLWLQDLYGSSDHILGPAHGFAGNVFVLARGDLLDPARRGYPLHEASHAWT